MEIEFDPDKRQSILAERGIDLASAAEVLEGRTITEQDDRWDYGEPRFITIGLLNSRMVIVVWTPRGTAYRIISMRKANAREQAYYGPRLRG